MSKNINKTSEVINEVATEVTACVSTPKFDFIAPDTVESEERGELGKVMVWKREYKDAKGEIKTCSTTDTACIESASRLDILLSLREFSSLGVCYELSVLAENKAKLGFKSIGEIGANLFNLKNSTALSYARVGRLFVNMVESESGIKYELKPEFKGASVANLVQVLSLVDEKSDKPMAELLTAMKENKIHLEGTLSNLKKELKDLHEGNDKDENGNTVIDTKATDISSIKSNVSECISVLLAECEHLTDEKKADAIVHITALQDIFTNLTVEVNEGEKAE